MSALTPYHPFCSDIVIEVAVSSLPRTDLCILLVPATVLVAWIARHRPKSVHMVFCFDTEYIPHYVSWLEKDVNVRRLLENTIICPPKFHLRKHTAETVLAC